MEKKWTRALALLCTLAMALALMVPAFAEDVPGTDGAQPENTVQDGEVPAAEQDAEPAEEASAGGEIAPADAAQPAEEAGAAEPAAETPAEPMTRAGEPDYTAEGFTKGTEEDSDYWWKLDENGTLTIRGTWMSGNPWVDQGGAAIKNVVIEAGMGNIVRRAFGSCENLTSVTIPSSVTSIGDGAFYGCINLANVAIPEGVASIGDYAFSYSGLTGSLTLPEGVTSIGGGAFWGCSNLTSVTIPSSVTSIGDDNVGAFSDCLGLTSVTISEGVTSIGVSTFANCTGLTSVAIPSSVTYIDDHAFNGCSGLTSVTIPSSVTGIGEYAFHGCTGLTGIPVPSSVTHIGNGAFSGCSGLTGIAIPEGVTGIGYDTFMNCTGLTSITIPSSVTSIGSSAFEYCTGLSEVRFAGHAPEINGHAFYRVTAAACYPQNDATWTEEARQQYDGTLTWVPYEPAQPEQPVQPAEPETPAQPEQPVQPAEPETPVNTATPGQIAGDLAQQVIASGGDYGLARQLLESILNNKDIPVDANITEAMRLAVAAAGGIGRGHQATENAYVYATYPQSFTEALQFAHVEVNAESNSLVLEMSFPEGKQSPLGVYLTVYLKETFDPALEYRWYCDDGSTGSVNVTACDNNGYKTCVAFYAPHFSTYAVLPVNGTPSTAPAASAEESVLKRTGGDISPAMGIVFALAAAAVVGCAPVYKKKRKQL